MINHVIFRYDYALILTNAFDSVVSVLGINKMIKSNTTNTQGNVINHQSQPDRLKNMPYILNYKIYVKYQ